MTDLEVAEEQRAEYRGEYSKDEVTGKMKKIAPSSQIIRVFTYWVILLFIVLVIIILVSLFLYKAYLTRTNEWGAKMIGILTAVQIKVLNFVSSS